jgi:very-short-patch-repair endonuclease
MINTYMNRNEIKEFLKEPKNKKALLGSTKEGSKYYTIYQDIQRETSFLPDMALPKHRIYYIQNDLFERMKCACGCGEYPILSTNKYIRGHGNKIQEVKDKKIQSCKTNHGVNNPSQCNSIKQKKKDTFKKHYNTTHYFNSSEGREAIKHTMIKKYGVDNYFKLESIKNHNKNRFKNGEGVDIKQKIKNTNLDIGFEKMLEKIEGKFEPLFNRSDYIGVCKQLYKFKCSTCNSTCYGDMGCYGFPRCYICNPLISDKGTSNIEGEVQLFISNIESNIRCRVRDLIYPFEIDIVAMDQKVGIEINGLYWHSEEMGKNKTYHIEKTKKCHERGYKLIHIFEDEWKNKKRQVQNKLINILNKSKYNFNASACYINEIDETTKNMFLEKYHIYGAYNEETKNIGIYIKNRLLMVICIKKTDEFRIVRVANMFNVKIIGWGDLVYEYIKKTYNANNISIQIDNRWDDNEFFNVEGINAISEITPPQPWYLKDNIRYPASIFNLLKESGLLNKYNVLLDEYENLKLHGYSCIWDCGHTIIKYESKPPTPSLVPLSTIPYNEVSIRNKDHLDYSYPFSAQQNELENVRNARGDPTSTAFYTKIVLSHQPHYYDTEKKMWYDNNDNVRDRLLANRLKYIGKNEYQIKDKEVLRGFKISGIHIGFTHFNPLWIKYFIEKYNITSIYDPTAGWGHRLLGSQNIKYIGNDWDERTYNGLCNIVKDFDLKDVIIYNNDCSNFTPPEDYQAVFTCPPYFNTEVYNNKKFKNLEDYKQWWEKTVKCALKPSTEYFAYVINHAYKSLLYEICEKNNLNLIEETILGRKLNHFQLSSAKVAKNEYMCIFKKK